MNNVIPNERVQLIAHIAARLIAAAHVDLDTAPTDEELQRREDFVIERALRIVERVEQRCGSVES